MPFRAGRRLDAFAFTKSPRQCDFVGIFKGRGHGACRQLLVYALQGEVLLNPAPAKALILLTQACVVLGKTRIREVVQLRQSLDYPRHIAFAVLSFPCTILHEASQVAHGPHTPGQQA